MILLFAFIMTVTIALVLKKIDAFCDKKWLGDSEKFDELAAKIPLSGPTVEDCAIWGTRNFENKLAEAGIMKVEEQAVCDDMECPFCKPTRVADGSWAKYRIQKELKTDFPTMVVPKNIIETFADRRGDGELWKSLGSPDTYYGLTYEQFCEKRAIWRVEQAKKRLRRPAPGGVKPKPAKYPPTPPNGNGGGSHAKPEMTVSSMRTRLTTVGPYKILRPAEVPPGALVSYTYNVRTDCIDFFWQWQDGASRQGFRQSVGSVEYEPAEEPVEKCMDCGIGDPIIGRGRCFRCQMQAEAGAKNFCKDCGIRPDERFGICKECTAKRVAETKAREPLPCVIGGCETLTQTRFQLCHTHASRENIQIASKELGIDRLNEVNTKPKMPLNELNAKVKELEEKNKKFKAMTKELEQKNKQINDLLASTTVDDLLGDVEEVRVDEKDEAIYKFVASILEPRTITDASEPR